MPKCQPSARLPRDIADITALMWCELSRRAAEQSAEAHRPKAYANEPVHLEVERFTYATDLSRPPLGDGELQFPFSSPERTVLHRSRQHQSIFELQALPQLRGGGASIPMHRGNVGALDLTTRVRQPMRSVALA